MSRMDIDGGSVEYLENGSGQPVVLLHSTGASGAQWRALVERLGAGFHVLAPDLCGYGSTTGWSGRGAFGLAHEAALVGALLERLDEPAHLVGHSYGGAVALHIARTQGERLRSLTLFEPVAFHLLRAGDANDEAALREISEVAAVVVRSLACGDYAEGAGHTRAHLARTEHQDRPWRRSHGAFAHCDEVNDQIAAHLEACALTRRAEP